MKSLMIQGTSSGAGKTTLVTALCRLFSDRGYSVAPFKAQNMSNYSFRTKSFEIARAQAIQAIAARCPIIPELNPILLKPMGNYLSSVYLLGKYFKRMHANEYYKKFVRTKGFNLVTKTFENLQQRFDLIILEGAGSPAEINLSKYDISNMRMAHFANSPVLLITDIERGGSFASLVGTMALLDKKYQKLVRGFVMNKFRGDINILKPGFQQLTKLTKLPVMGTIPLLNTNLPEEDSLDVIAKDVKWNKNTMNSIENEIEILSKHVKSSLQFSKIEKMINDS